jgi:membrane-bound lytic murein transglycosylase D
MKVNRLLALIFFLIAIAINESIAQTVPSEMKIGDLKLSITEHTRKQIQQDVDRLTRSETYYGILVDRMNLYFPIIEREFEEAGIPQEIKFLAIQESALISDAVSSANAVGFWQFKDFTAREVGLKVDRNVDERLNITSASKGSAKYLNSHNFFFDNWVYSIMAYNTGRGGAAQYVDKSQYGVKKMTINNQTHWYVKKFIAHVVAFSPAVGKPHSEGIWLDEKTKLSGKTLEQIAKSEKIELEELKKYNKWLKNGEVPNDKSYSILVPKEGRAPKRLEEKEEKEALPLTRISEPATKIYPSELTPGISDADKHTIITLNGIPSILARNYDDVFTLSTRATLSEHKFRKYNDLGAGDKLVSGEFYYIKKKKGRSKIGYHIAQKGESLWSVSQQYGIKVDKLAKKNGMSTQDRLKAGRVLWLKKTRPSSTEIVYHEITEPVIIKPIAKPVPQLEVKSIEEDIKMEEPEEELELVDDEVIEPIIVPIVDSSAELIKVKIHTVAAGESLWSIAKKYDLKMDDLLRWNELENPDQIGIGQNIEVKAPILEASSGKQLNTHTVQPGDTLYGISRLYNMTLDEIMDLNHMNSPDLNVGTVLTVYKK